jgi:hypothetical protein
MAKTKGSGKFRSAAQMMEAWERYKEDCDHKTKWVTSFSQREGRHISEEVPAPVSYSLKGFALFCGMTEQNFFATYKNANKEKFELVIARIQDECEIDVKQKLESGRIESRLSGLLLSKYGYTTSVKAETDFTNIDNLIAGINKMAES